MIPVNVKPADDNSIKGIISPKQNKKNPYIYSINDN